MRSTADRGSLGVWGAGGWLESPPPPLLSLLLLGFCGDHVGVSGRGMQGTRDLLTAVAGQVGQGKRQRESEFSVSGSGAHRHVPTCSAYTRLTHAHVHTDTCPRAVHTHT